MNFAHVAKICLLVFSILPACDALNTTDELQRRSRSSSQGHDIPFDEDSETDPGGSEEVPVFLDTPCPFRPGKSTSDESGLCIGNNQLTVDLPNLGLSLIYNSAESHVDHGYGWGWRLSVDRAIVPIKREWVLLAEDEDQYMLVLGDGTPVGLKGDAQHLVPADPRLLKSNVNLASMTETLPDGTVYHYQKMISSQTNEQSLTMYLALASVVTADGHKLIYRRDQSGRLVEIMNEQTSENIVLSITTGGGDADTKMTITLQSETSGYELNLRDNYLVSVSSPGGMMIWDFDYSSSSSPDQIALLSSYSDPSSNLVSFRYFENKRLKSVIDRFNLATYFSYEKNVVRSWNFASQTQQQFMQVKNPAGNLFGVLTKNDAGGLVTTVYRESSFPFRALEVRDHFDRSTKYSYFGRSYLVRKMIRPDQSILTYHYEQEGPDLGKLYQIGNRLLSTTESFGGREIKTMMEYQGKHLSRTKVNGYETRYIYDDLGRVVSVYTQGQLAQIKEYHPVSGVVVSESSPLTGRVTTYTYDSHEPGHLPKLIQVMQNPGNTVSITYDNQGRQTEIDTNGIMRQSLMYDKEGRVQEVKTFSSSHPDLYLLKKQEERFRKTWNSDPSGAMNDDCGSKVPTMWDVFSFSKAYAQAVSVGYPRDKGTNIITIRGGPNGQTFSSSCGCYCDQGTPQETVNEKDPERKLPLIEVTVDLEGKCLEVEGSGFFADHANRRENVRTLYFVQGDSIDLRGIAGERVNNNVRWSLERGLAVIECPEESHRCVAKVTGQDKGKVIYRCTQSTEEEVDPEPEPEPEIKYLLTVSKEGTGQGRVQSVSGIDCGIDCEEEYLLGNMVVLTASPAEGSIFAGWSGACGGTATSCIVMMSHARTVTAIFNALIPLVVEKEGSGTGTVTSSPLGINCGGSCSAGYPSSLEVTLTASVDFGSRFIEWRGDGCSGASESCTVAMTSARRVTAVFSKQHSLVVSKEGAGSGSVTSSPSGISCGNDCREDYDQDQNVTLTAVASSGSRFEGWSGACSGTANTCTITINQVHSVTAIFSTIQHKLTVTTSGGGSVTSSPAGINCGGDCEEDYAPDKSVTLTATASSGSRFKEWGGACGGTANSCTVTMNEARSVSATFGVFQHKLTVSKLGEGSGSVTSASGINCGSTCEKDYDLNSSVVLTASASSGSHFAGWGGACSGTANICTVTMSDAHSVTATFNALIPLSVEKIGNGTGMVTSYPVGITCGGSCVAGYSSGADVTLTAVASLGSRFVEWSGDGCSGTNESCIVSMTEARMVRALFVKQYSLTVKKEGNGSGTVKSSPTGINCGLTCSKDYDEGESVTLTASTSSGSSFDGWEGACSGTANTCSVSMSQVHSVTATFSLAQYKLTVTKSGTGTVTSSPSGINCGSTCSKDYTYNTSVTLTATPSSGQMFTGWGGACSGTNKTCTVSMTAARSVSANFAVERILTVTKAGNGSGQVLSTAPAGGEISCGSICSAPFANGANVTLQAYPDTGSSVTWSGACSGTSNTCSVSMTAARSVTATFNTPQRVLTVKRTPTQGGSVKAYNNGTPCSGSGSCQFTVLANQSVPVIAEPAPGYSIDSWVGCASISADKTTCTVIMNNNREVEVKFKSSNSGGGSGGSGSYSLTQISCYSSTNAFGTILYNWQGSIGSFNTSSACVTQANIYNTIFNTCPSSTQSAYIQCKNSSGQVEPAIYNR